MMEETGKSMNELSEREQEALIECLAALEAGADVEACLAVRPEHAESLRPWLEFRAQLLGSEVPTPPPAAIEAGREALLGRVAARPAPKAGRLPMRFRWARSSSPLARVAAVAAVLVLLAGGALGASAGAGFEPARDVLSALPVIKLASPGGGTGRDHTPMNPTQARGGTPATPGRDGQAGPGPQEIPGMGLCFAEGEIQNRAGVEDLLEPVPDVGLCIPERLLGRSADGGLCVPAGIGQRLADALGDQTGELLPCGPADTGRPTDRGGSQPTATPPSDAPGGPPATASPSMGPQGPLPTEERGEQQGPSGRH